MREEVATVKQASILKTVIPTTHSAPKLKHVRVMTMTSRRVINPNCLVVKSLKIDCFWKQYNMQPPKDMLKYNQIVSELEIVTFLFPPASVVGNRPIYRSVYDEQILNNKKKPEYIFPHTEVPGVALVDGDGVAVRRCCGVGDLIAFEDE